MICCIVCILAVPPMVQAADHANENDGADPVKYVIE